MTKPQPHRFTELLSIAPPFGWDEPDPFFDEAHPAQRGATLVNSPSESRVLSPLGTAPADFPDTLKAR